LFELAHLDIPAELGDDRETPTFQETSDSESTPLCLDPQHEMLTSLTFPLVALAVGLLTSLLATPIARRVALAWGLVDHPDNIRKLHREPIALCGGMSILLSLFLSVGAALLVFPELLVHLEQSGLQAISLGIASIAIVILGLLDDRFTLRGRQKLAGQVLICLSMISFGFSIHHVQMLGVQVELGLIAVPITLLWLLLCINSINLIDGADGLCSSVGWIAFAAVSIISSFTGNHMEAILAGAMAGALLGFLYFNLPPARVYLGDAGSMLIGLLLGVLTMRSWFSNESALSLTTPIVLMAIPLFDSMMAVLRRKLTGRSVFTVDRGHLHHNLMRHGITNRSLVAVITLLSLITASGAVAGVLLRSDWISLITMIFAIGSLVVSRVFGFAELQLLWHRVRSVLVSLVTGRGAPLAATQQIVQLQGTRNWEVVWSSLVEFCEKHRLAQVSLDLNMPWLHEGFHANWHYKNMPEHSERWTIRLPLTHQGRVLGRLEFIGRHQDRETLLIIAQLTELLEAMQHDLDKMIDEFAAAAGQPVPNPVRGFSVTSATVNSAAVSTTH
jgi:UDP-GlcNAc:undecaprenyl-phosphate GlcNAc-1-phosphate transferase